MWKTVKGYEGFYSVSDSGEVKSHERIETVVAGWSRKKREKILKQVLDHNGYAYVDLCRDYTKRRFYIHQLVLRTFISEAPDGFVACHNDGNCRNNHISNLRWDTQKNNLADTLKHGTRIRGEKHKLAKLTVQDILKIRELHKSGYTALEIAKIFPCSRRNISGILSGEKWKHV